MILARETDLFKAEAQFQDLVDFVDIPAEEWHTIRITDDGETINIYIKGPAIDQKYADTPIFTISPQGRFEGHRIAIYNREFAGRVPHESLIDNVQVRRHPGRPRDP